MPRPMVRRRRFKKNRPKIKIKPKNRGKFTRWAKARGMTVAQATAKVKANPEKYSPGVRKMATFASNSKKWKKGRRKKK